MAYASLADYLEELAGCGQLARVAAEVDSELEIAEITRRVARRQGPALLFEQVRGQSVAVVTNVLGSESRVCLALGIESIDSITARIESLIQAHTPRNWFERLKTSDDQAGAEKFRAKTAKNGPCQQVVRLGRDVDLSTLPLVTQWPGESGPAMTGALLVTQDLAAEQRAVSVCTVQALAADRMAVVDEGASPFARHWAAYRQAGQRMPVAVVTGGDPAGTIAARIDLPPGVDFFHLTGLLRGKSVDVVKCRTHALMVPADADIILEGYLDPETPEAVVMSGGSRGGHHPIERPAPVLHVAAITHRTHPLLPMVVDTAEQGEAGALLKVRERVPGHRRRPLAGPGRSRQLRVRFATQNLRPPGSPGGQRPVGLGRVAIHQVSPSSWCWSMRKSTCATCGVSWRK